MGYYIDQIGNDFTIKKENIQKAWDSLIELFKIEKKSVLDSSGYHYAWINTQSVLNAKTFEDAMSEARWDMQLNEETGDIESIYFNGEKYGGDEDIILGSIAPYVENGSYIIMQGEEGERWKWKFINGVVEEIDGHWIWDDYEEMDRENVKDFVKYLIKEIESLPKTPNGHSKTYDEAMMIGIIENCLEDYLAE